MKSITKGKEHRSSAGLIHETWLLQKGRSPLLIVHPQCPKPTVLRRVGDQGTRFRGEGHGEVHLIFSKSAPKKRSPIIDIFPVSLSSEPLTPDTALDKGHTIAYSQDCLFQDPRSDLKTFFTPSYPKHMMILGQKSPPQNPPMSTQKDHFSLPPHPAPRSGGSYRRETATPRGKALHCELVSRKSREPRRERAKERKESAPRGRRPTEGQRVGLEEASGASAIDISFPHQAYLCLRTGKAEG